MRRLAFHTWKPDGLLKGQSMYILPIDDALLGAMNETEKEAYYLNRTNYGKIIFKDKQDPMNGWAYPFITGHKYKIHWGSTGLDFEKMTITLSERWEENDKNIYFIHNFTDVRALMDVDVNGVMYANETLNSSNWDITNTQLETGMNVLYNDTEVEEFHFIVNGRNNSLRPDKNIITLTAHRCNGPCMEDITDVALEDKLRYWSDKTNWPNETLPVEGDEVHIEPGWNMILDIENTPILKMIRINGRLTFKDDMNITLNAKHIFVRAGELVVGSDE
jgi:hypothetical protein